jgi:hypothetical protein
MALISPWHTPYLLHIPACGLHVGRYTPQPVSVLRPNPTLSPSSLLAQAILSQTFSRMNTPTYLKPSHSYTYLPMKMEQTECSEMSGYKIQMPGNYPEESIQQVYFLPFASVTSSLICGNHTVFSQWHRGRMLCTDLSVCLVISNVSVWGTLSCIISIFHKIWLIKVLRSFCQIYSTAVVHSVWPCFSKQSNRLSTRGLSGHQARRRVADSRGPVLVARLSLNK